MSKTASKAPSVASLETPAEVFGRTTFATNVIATVAGIAAREVPGVYRLGKGGIGDAVAKVSGTRDTSRGVHAEVGKKEVAVDLEMVVEYGYNLHEVARDARGLVGSRLEQMANLVVKEVNINVIDVHYAPDDTTTPSRRVE